MNLVRRAALLSLAVVLPLAALAQPKPADNSPPPAFGSCKGPMPKVKLTTSMGPIVLQLDRDKAPTTVQNFTTYVESGHYNGTIFHRVMDGFMIQGGGFTQDMQQKPTREPIRIESSNGLKNDAYTVAMARTSDPNSATSQFFINVVDNDRLNYASDMNPGYAVFGKVVQGRETVDKIRKVATGNKGMHANVPNDAVVIQKAECIPSDAGKGAAK